MHSPTVKVLVSLSTVRAVYSGPARRGEGEDDDESKQERKASAYLLMSSLILQQVSALHWRKTICFWLILANCVRCICHGVEQTDYTVFPVLFQHLCSVAL
jgi:hypothetical protein